MNKAQRKIGWTFVLILAVVMIVAGVAMIGNYDGGAGLALIIVAIAGIGVWAFIAAGSKKGE